MAFKKSRIRKGSLRPRSPLSGSSGADENFSSQVEFSCSELPGITFYTKGV